MAELVKWLRRRTTDSAPRRSGGASRRTRALFSEKCSRMKLNIELIWVRRKLEPEMGVHG